MEKRENHQWEGKPKPREIPGKSDNESSGVCFICGFECPTCCTATAPSARRMQEVSGRCGSCMVGTFPSPRAVQRKNGSHVYCLAVQKFLT